MTRTKFLIIGVLAFLLILLLGYLVIGGLSGGGEDNQPVTLTFWGPYDADDVYQGIIANYQKLHPNITIEYQQIPFEQYEQKLILALANDSGPDIWMMHNTWLPKQQQFIQPLPQTPAPGTKTPLFTYNDFVNGERGFVDVTIQDLTKDRDIYGLPLYVDTLALYYNKDMFNEAGITRPPKTYNEFNRDVQLLTKRDGQNHIIQSGAAIGTADNINRASDILMMMMIQSGAVMTNEDNTEATFARAIDGLPVGEQALQYYTEFSNPSLISPDPTKYRYAWDLTLPYSVDSFSKSVSGTPTAMMFNYSHQIDIITSRNRGLNFGVAEVPQPDGAPNGDKMSLATYWAPTVSKKSANTFESWQFLVYLATSADTANYLNNTGRPAARRDLVEEQKNDPELGVFARQSLIARSWYQADNSIIEKIFLDMISSVNRGAATEREALLTAENLVTLEMERLSN